MVLSLRDLQLRKHAARFPKQAEECRQQGGKGHKPTRQRRSCGLRRVPMSLDEDPLHGFLVGVKMLSEVMADLPTGHPGCLVAAYCYQDRLFDKDVRDLYTAAMVGWRRRFRERLDLIAARYPLASPSTSTILPTCCRPSPKAGSSSPRSSGTREPSRNSLCSTAISFVRSSWGRETARRRDLLAEEGRK